MGGIRVNGKLVEDVEVQLGATAGREFRIESGRPCMPGQAVRYR